MYLSGLRSKTWIGSTISGSNKTELKAEQDEYHFSNIRNNAIGKSDWEKNNSNIPNQDIQDKF